MIPGPETARQILLLVLLGLVAGLALRLWWPRRQLSRRWRARIQVEDLLKQVLRCELEGLPTTLDSLAGGLGIDTDEVARLIEDLGEAGLLGLAGGEVHLSPEGRSSAMHILRAHRLWERHLAEESGYDEREWHGLAEAREHELTPAEADALAARLGYPTHDPHGDPIPTAAGRLAERGGRPLPDCEPPCALRIEHVEDEPATVYAQLVAEGLAAGMEVYLVERTSERLRLWSEAGEHLLAPVVAANLHVSPVAAAQVPEAEGMRLSELEPGQQARVTRIGPRCRGAERRRMMDLGILPGTRVTAELRSPGGDPTAYRLRGALIALRRTQAENIYVQALDEEGRHESTAA